MNLVGTGLILWIKRVHHRKRTIGGRRINIVEGIVIAVCRIIRI
jgi:hypothetical protein